MHKSTRDTPYESGTIEGGAAYGRVQLAFTGTDAVGLVGKYRLGKGLEFAPHRHKDWLVVTVLSGRLRVSQRNGAEACTFGPGDTYLVEPGEVHTETALEDTEVVVINGPGVNDEQFVLRTVAVD